jgi:hypothetical protein
MQRLNLEMAIGTLLGKGAGQTITQAKAIRTTPRRREKLAERPLRLAHRAKTNLYLGI